MKGLNVTFVSPFHCTFCFKSHTSTLCNSLKHGVRMMVINYVFVVCLKTTLMIYNTYLTMSCGQKRQTLTLSQRWCTVTSKPHHGVD